MPELVSEHQVLLQWTDLRSWRQRENPNHPRSAGAHLSGIIRYVMQALKKLEEDDERDEMPVVVAAGLAWENWVVGLKDLEGMVWQPGEWEVDGVFGTPDGLSVSDGVWPTSVPGVLVLEEFKYTLKSEWTKGRDEQILKQTMWMWQLAANCYAMSEMLGDPVTLARLTVYWACGNYRPPSPMLKRYLIRFGEGELRDLWRNVILKNRDAEGVIAETH